MPTPYPRTPQPVPPVGFVRRMPAGGTAHVAPSTPDRRFDVGAKVTRDGTHEVGTVTHVYDQRHRRVHWPSCGYYREQVSELRDAAAPPSTPDHETEIRREITERYEHVDRPFTLPAKAMLDAAVTVAVRRVTEAQAGATALREDAETAHAALDRITVALGEDPEQVTGSSVPSLVEDTLGRTGAELAA